MFSSLQGFIVFAVSLVTLIGAVWAFADSMRYTNATYVAAGKRSKVMWGLILGGVMVLTFVLLPAPLGSGGGVIGIIGVIAIIVIAYYFVDVRKHLQENKGGYSGGGW